MFLALVLLATAGTAPAKKRTVFEPGKTWPDNKDPHFNAHGGVLQQGPLLFFGRA
jgi:hypothetical protein